MITITRSMARLVRAVMRRALGSSSRSLAPALLVESGPGGLLFKARSYDLAIEYRAPVHGPTEAIAVPIQLLQDCEGNKDEPVQLKLCGKGIVEAAWQDGCLPQIKQYDVRKPDEVLKDFPTAPDTLNDNPHALLTALKDAADTADQNAIRYATNKLRFAGESGSVAATDGRHLLVQRGFSFPWKEDLLIPANKVFGGKELVGHPVRIGRTESWVTLAVGPWTLHLRIDKEGRFPRVEDHIQLAATAKSRMLLSDSDAMFLVQALDRLPCDEDSHFAVTVDLNGQVIVRAKSAEQPRTTELVLSGSQCTGEPVVLNTNRNYLARAVKLGFREVLIFVNDRPVLCRDDNRSFVWALLEPDGALKSSKDAIRIESPSQDAEPASQPKQQRKPSTMPRRKASDFGVVPPTAPSNGTENGQPDGASNGAGNGTAHGEHGEISLIEQAEAVRTSLKESVDRVGDLIVSLKRHRKQSRLVQSTLTSLKQLQSLDA